MTGLCARGLTVRLGGATVLTAAAFSVSSGEVVGLIGPNGAGKTTLLRALAGLIAAGAMSGTIELDGRPLAALARTERARAVAYLAQAGEVHWPVTVESLVTLGRLPHRDPWQHEGVADRAAVAKALAACDVVHLAARPVDCLSGGERARVLLARALAAEPEILLADEPVSGLDPAHGLDVLSVLRARARAGMGIVIVAHDLGLAARACDRLVLLHRGHVVADGRPEDVLTDEHLAQCYGIRAWRGVHEGVPFIVPLDRLGDGDGDAPA